MTCGWRVGTHLSPTRGFPVCSPRFYLDVNDRLFGSPHHTQTICQLGHHHSEVKEAEPAGVPTMAHGNPSPMTPVGSIVGGSRKLVGG